MCDQCKQELQGMPLAEAESKLHEFISGAEAKLREIADAPTPKMYNELSEEFKEAFTSRMNIVIYLNAAKVGGRKFLNPEADGIIISTSPLSQLLGIPADFVSTTWADTVDANSRMKAEKEADKRLQQRRRPPELPPGLSLP